MGHALQCFKVLHHEHCKIPYLLLVLLPNQYHLAASHFQPIPWHPTHCQLHIQAWYRGYNFFLKSGARPRRLFEQYLISDLVIKRGWLWGGCAHPGYLYHVGPTDLTVDWNHHISWLCLPVRLPSPQGNPDLPNLWNARDLCLSSGFPIWMPCYLH